MEKFNALVEQLNNLEITQKSSDWAECIPYEIWTEHFEGKYKKLKDGLNPDVHRWYETTITVIEIYGKPLGIRHISKLFSESSTCEDCYVTIEFFEMKEVTEVTYAKK